MVKNPEDTPEDEDVLGASGIPVAQRPEYSRTQWRLPAKSLSQQLQTNSQRSTSSKQSQPPKGPPNGSLDKFLNLEKPTSTLSEKPDCVMDDGKQSQKKSDQCNGHLSSVNQAPVSNGSKDIEMAVPNSPPQAILMDTLQTKISAVQQKEVDSSSKQT